MDSIVRRSIVCGSCGVSVTLYDLVCPHCKSNLEPMTEAEYRLPSSKSNEHALSDSESIKPFLDRFGDFRHFRVSDVDDFESVLKNIRDHGYIFRYFIYDLQSLTRHFRAICREDSTDNREKHLEILKRLEAVYISLTT